MGRFEAKNSLFLTEFIYDSPGLGFDFINAPGDWLKSGYQNTGQRGITWSKTGCYLAHRLVTLTFITPVLNLIGAVVALALGVLTLPTRLCGSELNNRCFMQFVKSGARFLDNLTIDLFYEFTLCCRGNSHRSMPQLYQVTDADYSGFISESD